VGKQLAQKEKEKKKKGDSTTNCDDDLFF